MMKEIASKKSGKRPTLLKEESMEKDHIGLPISITIINKKKKSEIRLNKTAFLEPSLAQNRDENQPIRRKEKIPTPSQPKNIEIKFILEVNNNIKIINPVRQKEKEEISSLFM